MNILYHSTAPWAPSSYSVLTARTVPNLVKAGHRVIVSTWYGLQGAPVPWAVSENERVTVLPSYGMTRGYGGDTLPLVYQEVEAEVLMTVCDVWVFPKERTLSLNFCPWFPVDHDPVPDNVLDSLRPALYPMCFSKWGTELLVEAGIKAHYVPCSAPGKVFSPGDKTKAREAVGFPSDFDFLISMIAANKDPQDRKGFNEALLGFAKFRETHPQAALYLHTDWNGALNLGPMVNSLDLQDCVLRPNPTRFALGMLKETYISQVYRASDVLLNPAKSEGFGLPLVEAQMCGCPVAASDYSTTDELLGAGWKIPTMPDWTNGANSYRARCTIDGIADALEAAYRDRGNKILETEARKWAIAYDNSRVFETYWKPALSDIEAAIKAAPQVAQMRVS